MPREKYNASWADDQSDIHIELACIEMGGSWVNTRGEHCGLGLYEHFMRARALLWPDRYRHRWTELMYREFIKNDVTILLGPNSSQKTSTACEFVLINYWCRPHKTLVIVSTRTMDDLDHRVFGEIKMLWQAGRNRFDFLAGTVMEHRRQIATDALEKRGKQARDLRKGIVGKACYVGQKWVGLGAYVGIKQEYMFFLGDELQLMQSSFIAAWPSLFSNGNVKIIGSGNPHHDPDDQLGMAAEPKDGWASRAEPKKTECWDTKYLGGRCVNLVGTDSPNFDVPEGQPEPYPKLMGHKLINRVIHDYGINSPQYYTNAVGVMRIDLADMRVITRQLCRDHHAQELPHWEAGERHRVYGLDPSYGGADLCVGIPLEWGPGEGGLTLIHILAVDIITIDLRLPKSPEDQVADRVGERLDHFGIRSDDLFYDPYGKGTMGAAFARKWGTLAPKAVDSGAKPTDRAVRQDLFIDEPDGTRRPKKCSEHYIKFISEAYFSVAYAIMADQMRALPDEVMVEGCARRYRMGSGAKIEIEPKDEFKERLKYSPNKFDALAVAMEGARQRGFVIAKLGPETTAGQRDEDWFQKEADQYREAIESCLLKH